MADGEEPMNAEVPTNAETSEQTDTTSAKKRRKRDNAGAVIAQFTIRKPTWSYLHLSLHYSPPSTFPEAIDAITARTHLTSALHQFLGLTGTAIPIDILKIANREVWIRVPREDASAVVAAAGGWVGGSVQGGTSVGWRVIGKAEWLPQLVGGDGRDLFDD